MTETENNQTFELEVTERFKIMELLPKEGNFVTLKILQEVKKQLSLTEQEIHDWDVVFNGNSVNWNHEKASPVKIIFSELGLLEIKKSLKALEEKNKLPAGMLDIYEKIIGS